LEGLPILREAVGVGAARDQGDAVPPGRRGLHREHARSIEPSALHQHATGKIRDAISGFYDGVTAAYLLERRTLAPILLSPDGSIRRLERGGTVVGLFDHMTYEEGCVELAMAKFSSATAMALAEPENDYENSASKD